MAATARVALVNMPFAMADRPSIQCGLLKAGLVREGHEVDVFYLNLELAAELGASLYSELAQLRAELLLGDWLFSVAAFGYRPDEAEYRQAVPGLEALCKRLVISFERLCELRNQVLPAWIARWAAEVAWGAYTAVGFTSTFEQSAASFALARAIKDRHPGVANVFGGANFDGTMGREYARALPWVDYVVVGEGDEVFPRVIERLAAGESPLGLAGVAGRSGDRLVDGGPAPRVERMDALPDPDYEEFFATLFRLGRDKVLGTRPPMLLFETARGCWWGEKSHCTFCGLNNNGMRFRAKSAVEAAGQLERLSGKYKILNFEAVDNIIDYKYIDELCRPLAERHLDYRLFYETKANLTPEQLRTLVRAGVVGIQPGIESLSSHILALMRKGVTMLRNVRLIKWAHYYGLRVSWNLLTGFPGETEEDYREQLRVLRLLRHLPPPQGAGPIWIERFSPYFVDPSFPVSEIKPLPIYRHIYPAAVDLDEIAYFFSYRMGDTVPQESHQELYELVDRWQEDWRKRVRPELVYQRAPGWIQILDRRTDELAAHAFEGPEAALFELCEETDRTVEALGKLVAERGYRVAPGEVRAALDKFCEAGLMLSENGRYLSLVQPANRHW